MPKPLYFCFTASSCVSNPLYCCITVSSCVSNPLYCCITVMFACLQPSPLLFYYELYMCLQGNIMTVAVFRRVTGAVRAACSVAACSVAACSAVTIGVFRRATDVGVSGLFCTQCRWFQKSYWCLFSTQCRCFQKSYWCLLSTQCCWFQKSYWCLFNTQCCWFQKSYWCGCERPVESSMSVFQKSYWCGSERPVQYSMLLVSEELLVWV